MPETETVGPFFGSEILPPTSGYTPEMLIKSVASLEMDKGQQNGYYMADHH